MKTTKEQRLQLFKSWMPTQKGTNKKMLHGIGTADGYIKNLRDLNELPIVAKNFGEGYDIFGDAAAADFQTVVEALETDPGFDVLNSSVKYTGVYSAALEKYKAFLNWLNNTPSDNELWDCLFAGHVIRRAEDFLRWMPTQISDKTHKKFSKKTAENYESRLRCGSYRGFNFFAVDTTEKLVKIRALLDATTDYKKFIKADKHALSSALDVYARFLMTQGV